LPIRVQFILQFLVFLNAGEHGIYKTSGLAIGFAQDFGSQGGLGGSSRGGDCRILSKNAAGILT
jgi:hypothetical protein